MKLTTLTALLFIIIPIAFNVTFFLLQRAFEYPDILRKPTDYILKHFKVRLSLTVSKEGLSENFGG